MAAAPRIKAVTANRKVYVRTYGCQMNAYDSVKIVDVLRAEQGWQSTADPQDADLIVFNTCSIRDKAQHKMRSDLGRLAKLKQAKPELLIGVGGCVASQEGAALVDAAPGVDLVFGPQTLHRLPAMIEARRNSGRAQVDIAFPLMEKFDHLPAPRHSGPCAYVSIMEGCSKYCSFCVVPYTRGEEASRGVEDVLTEIADLADQGVREVCLLGQNVNAYRGRLDASPNATALSEASGHGSAAAASVDFACLLELVAQIPGIARIRYTTSHPREFTPRLIAAHARLPKLALHVHLPVQSGSDRILAAMKRGYTALEYKSIVRRLRAAQPALALASDFIVGFPGETEADFQQTLRLVEEVGFDASFSFLYSRRPGTPAADLPDATPASVQRERLQRLQALLDAQESASSRALVGSTQRVLVEAHAQRDPGELTGRCSSHHTVNFAGPAKLIGELVDVKIVDALHHSLRGRLLEAA